MKSITQNTVYNLLGYSLPILLALFLVPEIIEVLGKERFGILSLVWIAIGYLSFFDFGLGRSLTKIISEKLIQNNFDDIPTIFWSSILLMFGIGSVLCLILVLILPSNLINVLKISESLKPETEYILIIVILSLPLVATNAALRGVLEAYQRFDIVNTVRIILGIFTFLGPIIVLHFINSLFWVVIFLIGLRSLTWLSYLFFCFKQNKMLLNNVRFNFNKLRPLINFGIWISIANLIGPLLLYSDRLFLGMLISAVAITYYSTPYEIISKLLIFPSSLSSVLLPTFSANYSINPDVTKKLFLSAGKIIYFIIYPIVFLVVLFSNDFILLWLGKDFAINSSRVLQLLSIGILMNCLSSIPNIFFQGTGIPKIPTIINLFELPFYLLFMWGGIVTYGIVGAAAVYMVMAGLDAILMYVFALKIFEIRIKKNIILTLVISLIFLVVPFNLYSISLKIFCAVGALFSFYLISWKTFLSSEEKNILVSKFDFRKTLRFLK